MTIKQASWTHGHSFVAEQVQADLDGFPATSITGLRQGGGVTYRILGDGGFRPRRHHWFHTAVPSTPILDGQPLFLDKIYVLFVANGPLLADVHLWDAGGAIWRIGVLAGTPFQEEILGGGQQGDFSAPRTEPRGTVAGVVRREFSNGFSPRAPDGSLIRVRFGLGISVGVIPGNQTGTILFRGAGADFVDGA